MAAGPDGPEGPFGLMAAGPDGPEGPLGPKGLVAGAAGVVGVVGPEGLDAGAAGVVGGVVVVFARGGLPGAPGSFFSGCASFVAFASAFAFTCARACFKRLIAAPATPAAADPTFPIALEYAVPSLSSLLIC